MQLIRFLNILTKQSDARKGSNATDGGHKSAGTMNTERRIKMSKEWSEFNKFDEADEKYLPACGEGDTMASQITTAVCKLVYKWYNDGDVFDNTNGLGGWCNDLSSYANWLWKYCNEARGVIAKWWYRGSRRMTESDYEDMLYELDVLMQLNNVHLFQ